MTKYEEQFYRDIHRIADALEKLANPEKPHIFCPRCSSPNTHRLYKLTGSRAAYVCEDCHGEFDETE